MTTNKKTPSALLSLLPIIVLVLMLVATVRTYGSDSLSGASQVTSATLILLLIGALSGTWMVSGVVPSLIYYGIQIIHPDIFLASTCIISAIVSVMTGSSWTTIATIGVALMGIGKAQGFAEGE